MGAPINLTASGQVIAGTSAKKTYICSFDLVSATAQNIALVEGTGSTCATNIYGLVGGTTAATGWNLAANGGLTKGNGGGTISSRGMGIAGRRINVCVYCSAAAARPQVKLPTCSNETPCTVYISVGLTVDGHRQRFCRS
jgi:hypothetical protein